MDPSYPFYSPSLGIGVVPAYHTHPACQIARSIPLNERQPGRPAGWPECIFCALHHTPFHATRLPALLLPIDGQSAPEDPDAPA